MQNVVAQECALSFVANRVVLGQIRLTQRPVSAKKQTRAGSAPSIRNMLTAVTSPEQAEGSLRPQAAIRVLCRNGRK